MIHFEHELNEMANRMLGGGLQSSIRSTSNAWSSFFGLPFICSASGWPPGVVESLAAGK